MFAFNRRVYDHCMKEEYNIVTLDHAHSRLWWRWRQEVRHMMAKINVADFQNKKDELSCGGWSRAPRVTAENTTWVFMTSTNPTWSVILAAITVHETKHGRHERSGEEAACTCSDPSSLSEPVCVQLCIRQNASPMMSPLNRPCYCTCVEVPLWRWICACERILVLTCRSAL